MQNQESLMKNQEPLMRNKDATIKNLEVQLRQLANIVYGRVQGILPSDTEKNPREYVKAVWDPSIVITSI